MHSLAQVGDRLGPVMPSDVDGEPVPLTSLLDRPLVIPLVRYYGCMPCKAFLHGLNHVRGGAADYQARAPDIA